MDTTLELLSAHDVADRFRVSGRTVRRWVDAGLITPVKVDHGAYIFTADAVGRFRRPARGGARQRHAPRTAHAVHTQ